LNFGEVAPSGNTQGWVCLGLNFKFKTQNQQKFAFFLILTQHVKSFNLKGKGDCSLSLERAPCPSTLKLKGWIIEKKTPQISTLKKKNNMFWVFRT
jgi:hypothetical protein